MKTTRNTGVDLLRIVSMCMIVMIHMNSYGKASTGIETYSVKYFVSQGLSFWISCAVNCYALISGFVNNTTDFSRRHFKSIARMWGKVFTYSVGLMVVFVLFRGIELTDKKTMAAAFFPAMSMQYWYFTDYLPVVFLMPFMNLFLEKIDLKKLRQLVMVLLLLFSVIPWVTQTDWFDLNNGFSTFWLIILYIVGAWIRKELPECKVSQRTLLISLFALIGFQVIIRFSLDMIGNIIGRENLMHAFSGSIAPFIVLEACIMLMLFARIKWTRQTVQDIISKIGMTSFGVYLIHDNYYVRNYLLMNHLAFFQKYNAGVWLICMFSMAILIYGVCAILETGRRWLACQMGSLFGKTKGIRL